MPSKQSKGSDSPNSGWVKFERISKIIQLVSMIAGAAALVYIPIQIHLARNEIGKNTFEVLWKIDSRLSEGKNNKISTAISHHKPVITNKITEDDLDSYLGDLSSISDAKVRRLISMDDIYEWFYDDVINSYENPEIKDHIAKIRKDDPEYYHSLDELYKELKQYSGPNK
jgi:hypothetical protein